MYKTDYFIRFVGSKEQARRDLRRGYSFEGYMFFPTKQEAREYWQELGVDDPNIAKSGQGWGLRLSGLCGFGPYESIEEARDDAIERGGYAGIRWPYAAIYIGRYIGDCGDGDMFRPDKLVTVVEL